MKTEIKGAIISFAIMILPLFGIMAMPATYSTAGSVIYTILVIHYGFSVCEWVEKQLEK